ncbi:unnamed protein product [Caenorhabditis nigoni]
MFNSQHVPLIIDPSGQVSTFLAKFLDKSETFKAAQPDLMTQIELAIRFGKTIIVEDVVEFDAALIPILRRDLSSQGPRQVISFGGKSIDYNSDFKIFICTRDDKVEIRPNASVQLNIVNFTTTISALSAQLLDVAIHLEKPELEERSSSLLRDAELKKLELEGLEQLLLQQLATSQGNLLENTALLDSLNKSKESAEIISKSIVESEQLHKELTTQKEIYVPLSQFTSSLFFSFSNLQYYNPMYNYSVNTIMKLFEKTIKSCEHLSLTTPHENFRLWLTTEADARFPSMMLQQSLKITFEPPPGVRNNLLRTYTQIDRNGRSVVTCQSIFVLAWLHALLQERRTFIPQGWTKFYEFSASDVRVAKSFVEQLTENKPIRQAKCVDAQVVFDNERRSGL